MSTQKDDRTSTTTLAAVQALIPTIRASADQIERDRRLPQSLVGAMTDAGRFKLSVPQVFGGAETDPATFIKAIEEVSRADGSTGWLLMSTIQAGVFAAYLPWAAGMKIYGDPRANVAGVVFPAGRAVAVEGGYRVTGRWRYASGCMHATWLTGASVVYDGDTARNDANGTPVSRWFYFPIADCRIHDTWHVMGMRGTGSHDFSVEDLFVPAERTFPHRLGGTFGFDDPGEHRGALYTFGINVVSCAFGAVPLGIARGALDAFVKMVGGPGGAKAHLRNNALIHVEIGKAEAQLRAARTFLDDVVAAAWKSAVQTGEVPIEQRQMILLAARNAVVTGAQGVEALWYAAGAAAIYESNPLERRFRDAHVMAQRIGSIVYGEVGRMRLGVE
jgi:alkylation response protein AidB-like acyl-CoA dehydrogenase